MFLEPSKCKLQLWRYGSFSGCWASSQSAMKSARACDLIALRGSYLMLWTPISTTHLETRPVASRLRMMSYNGAEETTMIGCSCK